MSTKFKIIIATLLTIALIFGGTLNFSEAAAKSTTKIISDLKKEVKKLTTSNKRKDKEIAKLKKDINAKNNDITKLKDQIKIKDRDIAGRDKDFTRVYNNYKKSQQSLRDFESQYERSLYSNISNSLLIEYQNKYYCTERPSSTTDCTGDIKIGTNGFYMKNMFDYINKQTLKETVVSANRAIYNNGYTTKNIILEFPDGDIVIPISTEL